MGITNFKGGPSWCYRFMKRNGLSIRARTTQGQQLPPDWEQKTRDFLSFLSNATHEHNIPVEYIINMDEVPLAFDIPATRTVNKIGEKTVPILTTGLYNYYFTINYYDRHTNYDVALCICALFIWMMIV